MNQPPFDRKDLSVPPLDGPEFIQLLHDQRNEMYPQPPAFYEALIEGRLSREVLALWVKNQYYYWGYGLTFSTGAIVCKTNEPALRRLMIRKSVRVEGKNVVKDLNPEWVGPAYEELWLQFGEGLGIDRDEVTSFHPYTRSYFAVSTLCLLARWWEWSWLDGIASFYAADLLGRDYMPQVYDALRQDYGVSSDHLLFFPAFLEDVTESVPWEEEALAEWACTTERQLTAARAFRNRLDIEHQLLLPLHHVATGELDPLQVP